MWSLEKQKELIKSLPVNATEVNIMEAYDEELACVMTLEQLARFMDRWATVFELRLLPITAQAQLVSSSIRYSDLLEGLNKYRDTRNLSDLSFFAGQVIEPIAFRELECAMSIRECKRPQEVLTWFLSRREEVVETIERFQEDYYNYTKSKIAKLVEEELEQGRVARERFIIPFCKKHKLSFINGKFNKAIDHIGDEARALHRLVNWRFNRDIPFGKAIEDYNPESP